MSKNKSYKTETINTLIHRIEVVIESKKTKIEIDRKILANLAEKHPEVFKKIVEKVK